MERSRITHSWGGGGNSGKIQWKEHLNTLLKDKLWETEMRDIPGLTVWMNRGKKIINDLYIAVSLCQSLSYVLYIHQLIHLVFSINLGDTYYSYPHYKQEIEAQRG